MHGAVLSDKAAILKRRYGANKDPRKPQGRRPGMRRRLQHQANAGNECKDEVHMLKTTGFTDVSINKKENLFLVMGYKR